jgi:broad specificity phosphatase PhoE
LGYLERWLPGRRVTSAIFKIALIQTDILRSPEQVSQRLDRLIADIRSKYHEPAFQGNSDRPDVLIVAHGHILRAFAMRWIGRKLENGVALLLEG